MVFDLPPIRRERCVGDVSHPGVVIAWLVGWQGRVTDAVWFKRIIHRTSVTVPFNSTHLSPFFCPRRRQ
jgi:hypothetical protein